MNGEGDVAEKKDSKQHVEGINRLVAEARKYYKVAKADNNLKIVYFDENEGRHAFPPKIKEEVYHWLDMQLKK